jgi:hypothetical protein
MRATIHAIFVALLVWLVRAEVFMALIVHPATASQ